MVKHPTFDLSRGFDLRVVSSMLVMKPTKKRKEGKERKGESKKEREKGRRERRKKEMDMALLSYCVNGES